MIKLDYMMDPSNHSSAGRNPVQSGVVVLISTYELGRQPFGLASPAAHLKAVGAEVHTLDLSVQHLDRDVIDKADMVGFYLPMHTATRLAVAVAREVRGLNPRAHLAFFGLYAAPNADLLTQIGAQTILSGEFEPGLVETYRRLMERANGQPVIQSTTERIDFTVPDRGQLPPLKRYAHLIDTQGRAKHVGYTEASRGCKHRCRHCPVVPVYDGRFRIVPREIILQDIAQQVAAGAEHITFGDPDFFNGIGHALPLVETLHERFPKLTYDVTIKVEHLIRHAQQLETLKQTGCLIVTTAVESFDGYTLAQLDKGHSPQDFKAALEATRQAGLHINPTFIAFHPWISLSSYVDFLEKIERYDLVDHIAPIQLAIRLLIPSGSKLLELEEVQAIVQPFDGEALAYPWAHPDPRVDELQTQVAALVETQIEADANRAEIFTKVRQFTRHFTGLPTTDQENQSNPLVSKPIPYLTENWYC
jgi:radical SAM superfamily enzyme YgiQ (UPF0313 family)